MRRAVGRTLRRRQDFRSAYERGTAVRLDCAVLIRHSTDAGLTRTAVVASRKVGNAVRRNRAKRLLREAERKLITGVEQQSLDLILIARPPIRRLSGAEVLAEVRRLYAMAGLLRPAAAESPRCA
ncbi:MAG: ribonuclease P protein component [Candidatus Eisenbacteria bacterium]|nr:ribonuclease P protein component [Candidatus Eisenbacteria bacterium]